MKCVPEMCRSRSPGSADCEYVQKIAPAAEHALSPLVKSIEGLRPVDAGPLEMARVVEGITALLLSLNRRYRVAHSGIRITGLETLSKAGGEPCR